MSNHELLAAPSATAWNVIEPLLAVGVAIGHDVVPGAAERRAFHVSGSNMRAVGTLHAPEYRRRFPTELNFSRQDLAFDDS